MLDFNRFIRSGKSPTLSGSLGFGSKLDMQEAIISASSSLMLFDNNERELKKLTDDEKIAYIAAVISELRGSWLSPITPNYATAISTILQFEPEPMMAIINKSMLNKNFLISLLRTRIED